MGRHDDFAQGCAQLAAYLEAALPPFHQVRAVVAQLGALLLLTALRRSAQAVDHPMLEPAREAYAEARRSLTGLTPGEGGAHAHHHLTLALDHVAAAFRAIDRQRLMGAKASRAPLSLLQAANREIGHASHLLSPFQIVDLSHACCAEVFGATPSPEPRTTLSCPTIPSGS